jgi:molybdate transport system substrate-binding protein
MTRALRTPSFELLVACLALAACGDPPSAASRAAAGTRGGAQPATAPEGPHEVLVFATQSLRAPFLALAQRYEADHPGAKITLRTDGGAELLKALNEGQRCDLLAIGDSSLMSRFAAATHLATGSPAELARNRIALAVAPGNPKAVRGLADLAREDLRVALGAASSSIGRHARWALSKLAVEVRPAREAAHADAVLGLVAAGEVDVGVVYATSFAAGSAAERLEIPEEQNTPVLYSISVARKAAEPRGAAALRALALSDAGQALIREAGFLPAGAK